jgi:hypothetical protein
MAEGRRLRELCELCATNGRWGVVSVVEYSLMHDGCIYIGEGAATYVFQIPKKLTHTGAKEKKLLDSV